MMNKKEYNKKYRQENKERLKKSHQIWRNKNREYCKEYNKKYREKNSEKRRDNHYKYKYGVTLEQYNQIFENQKGCCAICGKKEHVKCWGKLRPLAVDHNHKTKEIRGLLCCNCNRALGLLSDNIEFVGNMLKYLVGYRRKK